MRSRPTTPTSARKAAGRRGRSSGLSADIHLLGDLLGGAIRRLAGRRRLRPGGRDAHRRQGVAQPARRWKRRGACATGSTGSICPRCARLIRAFSIYFDLINLAEQQARVRALRLRTLQAGSRPLARKPRGGACAAARARRHRRSRSRPCCGARSSAPSSRPTPAKRGGAPSWKSWRPIARQLDRLEFTRLPPRDRERRRRRHRRRGRDVLADRDRARPPADRPRRGPAGPGRGGGQPARRDAARLPRAGGGPASRSIPEQPWQRPVLPPFRLLDRRRPRRPSARHARRHRRGGSAAAGDAAAALPRRASTNWAGS